MKTIYLALISFILALLLSFDLQAEEEIHVTVYGDAHYAPFSWQQSGSLVGIYPAILRRAFNRMEGYNIEIVPIPWNRGLRYLEYGKAFALFPPYFYPKIRPYISYSVPILPEQTGVLCHKDFFDKPRERWPEDYYGALIGRSVGYVIGGKNFQQAIQHGKIKIIEIQDSHHNLILMVGNGHIDCYLDEIHVLEYELKQLKDIWEYKKLAENIIFGPIVYSQMVYLGFTKTNLQMYPYKDDFVNQFNRIITEMQKSGEVEQIVQEYLSTRQTGVQ